MPGTAGTFKVFWKQLGKWKYLVLVILAVISFGWAWWFGLDTETVLLVRDYVSTTLIVKSTLDMLKFFFGDILKVLGDTIIVNFDDWKKRREARKETLITRTQLSAVVPQ